MKDFFKFLSFTSIRLFQSKKVADKKVNIN